MSNKFFTRRNFLQMSAIGVTGVLAACTPQVVKETVVVEKEVEKVVTQVVEKEVTKEVVKEVVKEVAPKTAEEMLPAGDQLGSPNHARGWKTTLPDLPAGVPYDAPIVINCTRRLDQQTTFCEGDDFDNNPWSRMIKALFNVEYKTAWTFATDDEGSQKYNLAMASGDVPDFLETIPLTTFLKMVEAGVLQDITDAYDMYASERWKGIWREYGDLPWTWTKIDGRIWGMSKVEDLAHNDCLLWYREDWLEKVGMSVPTTFDELKAVALAFVKNNLGQGAAGTTIGLLASNEYEHTWYGSLDAIWGGYGYIPDHWQPEGDGLMLGAVRPECKEALTMLNQWYSEGVFRKDFYTLNTSTALPDVSANNCGLHFTPSWGANADSVRNDPNARWQFADIPAGPNFKRRHTENNFRENPFAWRKGFDQFEALFTITDWWDQLWYDQWRRFHGWEGCNYVWEDGDTVRSVMGWNSWIPGPVGTRGNGMIDPKSLARNIRYRLEEWGKIPPAERDAYQELMLADPTGVQVVNDQCRLAILDTASEGVMTKLQRLPTPTQVERGADLLKLIDESYIGFITGQKPLSEFDAFVAQWKKQGGDAVTAEVNEWWATKK